ncbi:glycosyltransferase family A protein [Nocardioides sp. 616]|uniref:glycosyltransferase family 2 protein n=1 Tax=Nocardioides sp. 616 TaxID=2268090 RepID=UPI000CE30317|nr:glycosyltransferase family A protein [Nocardioides sp. 616]
MTGHRSAAGPQAAVTVSVVIPVLDDAVALRHCLELLSRQSLAPLEVVVVDNGSTDDSAQVARDFGAVVVHEPRRGIPMAAAVGYDAASGEVIARLDADSRPPRHWVARVARAMSEESRDAVTGAGWFYDLPWPLRTPVAWIYLGAYYALCHLALGHTAVWGSSMAVRRTTWQAVSAQVHREDPELHDDLDLAFVLGPTRRIVLDPTLGVGVSARSLRGGAQLRRRLVRALRTLRVNWAVQPPWLRWTERLGRALSRRRSAG